MPKRIGERRLLEERYRKFRRMGQQTADARAVVAREIAELQAEVTRLQYEQKMSPLAALQAVYAKLASGWLPPASR